MEVTVHIDPSLDAAETSVKTFGAAMVDLRPFWSGLAERLADDAQRRWPLRRKTGRLRRSLTWTGVRLGHGGVYKSEPSSLTIGTKVFYGFYSQRGTKHQARRPLVHVDEADVGKRLTEWAKGRAEAAGLEVS